MSTDFQNPRASARGAVNENKQYPELPKHFMLVQESFRDEVYLYTADQMRAYVDADRAMLAARDAEDAAHIKNLCELVRMPNAEYVADAHNAAVKYLRLRARANQEHKLSERTAKEGGAT